MAEKVETERDGPPLVEITFGLWSLDPDTCQEEFSIQWRERPEGVTTLDLFQLLRVILDDHIEHLQRHPPRP